MDFPQLLFVVAVILSASLPAGLVLPGVRKDRRDCVSLRFTLMKRDINDMPCLLKFIL